MPKLPDAGNVQQVNITRDPGLSIPKPVDTGIGKIGEQLADIGVKFQEAEDASQLSRINAESIKAITDFKMDLEKRPDDYGKWESEFGDFQQKLRETTKGQANSRVYAAWEKNFNTIEATTRAQVLKGARERQIDVGRAGLLRDMQEVADVAVLATDPETYRITLGSLALMSQNAQNTGLITEQEAFQYEKRARETIQATRFTNALEKDPSEALKNIDSFGFSELQRAKAVRQAKAAVEEQERVRKAEEREAKIAAKLALDEKRDADEVAIFNSKYIENRPWKERRQQIINSALDPAKKNAMIEHEEARIKAASEALDRGTRKLDKETEAVVAVQVGMAIRAAKTAEEYDMVESQINNAIIDGLSWKTAQPLLRDLDRKKVGLVRNDSYRAKEILDGFEKLDDILKSGAWGKIKKGGVPSKEAALRHSMASDLLVQWAKENPGKPVNGYILSLKETIHAHQANKLGQVKTNLIPGGAGTQFRKTGATQKEKEEAVRFLRDNSLPLSDTFINETIDFLRQEKVKDGQS